MPDPSIHVAALAQVAQALNQPMLTWRAQCVEHKHDSTEAWEVQARNHYEAGVQLRAMLREQGIKMPADLEWSVV